MKSLIFALLLFSFAVHSDDLLNEGSTYRTKINLAVCDNTNSYSPKLTKQIQSLTSRVENISKNNEINEKNIEILNTTISPNPQNTALSSAINSIKEISVKDKDEISKLQDELKKLNIEKLSCEKDKLTNIAGAGSKFIVREKLDDENLYAIQFNKLYMYSKLNDNGTKNLISSNINKANIYLLPFDVENIDTKKVVSSTRSGPVSGTLIVPFKYRSKDKSFSGIGSDTTIGVYVGWAIDTSLFSLTDDYLVFTPIVSLGLSNITITEIDTTDENPTLNSSSKNGFTAAIGMLVQQWGNADIGFIIGKDWVNDDLNWQYNGDTWLSLSFSWRFDIE